MVSSGLVSGQRKNNLQSVCPYLFSFGAYWKFQTNMLIVTAILSGAGILPAVFKEGLLEAGPTLQMLSNQLPPRGHFFRAGSRKKPSDLPIDYCNKNKKI